MRTEEEVAFDNKFKEMFEREFQKRLKNMTLWTEVGYHGSGVGLVFRVSIEYDNETFLESYVDLCDLTQDIL